MADFVAWNLPTAKQASNDSGLGSRSDVLGEVKTMQPGKCSYQTGNCQENRPVDQRATKVRRDYSPRGELPASIRHMHQKLSGMVQMVRWDHLRQPLELFTPATPTPFCRRVRRSQ